MVVQLTVLPEYTGREHAGRRLPYLSRLFASTSTHDLPLPSTSSIGGGGSKNSKQATSEAERKEKEEETKRLRSYAAYNTQLWQACGLTLAA